MFNREQPSTLITEGTELRGTVTFEGKAFVHGRVEGDIIQLSSEPLRIGRSAWIHGSIRSEGPLEIEGKVEGDVLAPAGVSLHSTARVRGRIVSPLVRIAPGAFCDGEIQRPPSLAASRQKQAA